MFKSSETATIEIENIDNCTDLLVVIKRCITLCNIQKIERMIIDVDCYDARYKELFESITALFENICVFVRTPYIPNINVHPELNYIFLIGNDIVQPIQTEKISENVFYEISLDDLEGVSYLNDPNIIWDIRFEKDRWEEFDNQLKWLLSNSSEEVMLKPICLEKDLVRRHPCNVYLCAGEHCHSKHRNVPRYLYVSKDGNVYPYGIKNNELLIGNIFNKVEAMIQTYIDGDCHMKFINLNRSLYLDIIDKCNYDIIPWFELLKSKI